MPVLPALLALAGPAAITAGATALGYWATTNVYQTHKISGDNARKLDLEWQEFYNQSRYLDLREDELEWEKEAFFDRYEQDEQNYLRQLAQSSLIASVDIDMQTQRLQLDADQFNMNMLQEQMEKNTYLQERVFKSTHSILNQYGNEKDVNKLTYLIMRLTEIQNRQNIATATPSNVEEAFHSETSEYDYTLWTDNYE